MPLPFTITSFERRKWRGKDTIAGSGYEEEWVIEFTGPFDVPAILRHSVSGKPKKLTIPDWDGNVIATDVDVELEENSRADANNALGGVAIFKVVYSPTTFALLRAAVHPLSRPQIVQGSGTDLTEVRLNDAAGALMVNSSKEIYLDLPEQPVQGIDFTITRNEASNPAAVAAQYSNTSNNAIWHGRPIGTVWLGKIAYREVLETFDDGLGGGPVEITYWEVSYPFRDRPDGWNYKPVDSGFYTWDGTKRVRILDDGNPTATPPLKPQPITSPLPLNGAGAKLATGGTPVIFPTAGYPILKPKTFATLAFTDPYS